MALRLEHLNSVMGCLSFQSLLPLSVVQTRFQRVTTKRSDSVGEELFNDTPSSVIYSLTEGLIVMRTGILCNCTL